VHCCLLQVQQLALLASTLQALVTACCDNTPCSSSSSKGMHLAAQLTRCLLDALVELDHQLSGCPSAAAAAADKAGAADASSIIQQCKHFVIQQQRVARASRERDGGTSPKASSIRSSPRAGFSFQQQQQQSDMDHLRQLTERAELEAERLQLKQERARIQEQVRASAN
jgi:hypothetical protein